MSQEEEDRRPTRPRSPTSEEFADFQHPAPAVRAHQPSGAHLFRLPDVLFPRLCVFLTTRAVYRLAATCSALSRQCFPSTVTLCRRDELLELEISEEVKQQTDRCGKALGALLRRGAGRLKELRVKDPELLEPLLRALRECGPAVQLELPTSLHVTLDLQPVEMPHAAQPSTLTGGVVVLGDVLGQLPMLRALHLAMRGNTSLLSPVWRALREGACPKLERLEMEGCSPAVLVGLASTLPSRPEGCARLKALSVHLLYEQPCEGVVEACRALADYLGPDTLEELSVRGWRCPAEWFNAAVSRLSSCEWPALRSLALSAETVTDERGCDALLRTLCGRTLPNLTRLDIQELRSSDDAWRALGEAMATGPCLRRLKGLSLREVFHSPEQMEFFMRGIGAGHGCPNLHMLMLTPYHEVAGRHDEETVTDWSPLAHALRPPNGLPQLYVMFLSSSGRARINGLVEALEHRPHVIKPLKIALLSSTYGMADLTLPSSLVSAAADGEGLVGLNMDQMTSIDNGLGAATASWMRQLMEAMEAGGGKALTEIDCSFLESAEAPAAMTNRLLRVLVHKGACPKLRRLLLELPRRVETEVVGGGLDMGLLQALLTGGAACSAKLQALTLRPCGLGAADLKVLEACLRDPRVVQLDSLKLMAVGDDALPALLAVLDVLGHGRAGARLKCLRLEVQGCTESQAQVVVERLVNVVEAGGLPRFAALYSATSSLPEIVVNEKEVGEAELRQAVKRRAGAVWQTSW